MTDMDSNKEFTLVRDANKLYPFDLLASFKEIKVPKYKPCRIIELSKCSFEYQLIEFAFKTTM